MSVAPLPKIVDPLKLAEQRVDLQGKIALNQFKRLKELMLDCQGEVLVTLSFGKDEQGIRTLKGHIAASVSLECQRCLQAVAQAIETDLALGLVFSDEAAKNLPGYYDPLMLENDELALWELVEEELILALPIAPKHAESDCAFVGQFGASITEKPAAKKSPFSVLEQLKSDK